MSNQVKLSELLADDELQYDKMRYDGFVISKNIDNDSFDIYSNDGYKSGETPDWNEQSFANSIKWINQLNNELQNNIDNSDIEEIEETTSNIPASNTAHIHIGQDGSINKKRRKSEATEYTYKVGQRVQPDLEYSFNSSDIDDELYLDNVEYEFGFKLEDVLDKKLSDSSILDEIFNNYTVKGINDYYYELYEDRDSKQFVIVLVFLSSRPQSEQVLVEAVSDFMDKFTFEIQPDLGYTYVLDFTDDYGDGDEYQADVDVYLNTVGDAYIFPNQ